MLTFKMDIMALVCGNDHNSNNKQGNGHGGTLESSKKTFKSVPKAGIITENTHTVTNPPQL